MANEVQPQPSAVLPPRAGLALLTLQLRSALQEAQAAEAEESALDEQAARDELRERLTPLMAERRAILENSLTAVRENAAAQVVAARRAAEAMLSNVTAKVHATDTDAAPAPVEFWAAEEVQVVNPEPHLEVEVEGLPPLGDLMASFAEVPLAPTPSVVPATETRPAVVNSATAPVHIGIDSEAFARVFAAVFATMLDERIAGTPQVPTQYLAPWAALPPAPAKKGFWASALHVDVLLLGAAMVIMLVVLAAWLA